MSFTLPQNRSFTTTSRRRCTFEEHASRGNHRSRAIAAYYQLLSAPPYNHFTYCDEIREVNRLLSALPEKQRLFCQLYFIEDCSLLEIAALHQLQPTTVKNHITWSMSLLRNYMLPPKAPV